MTAITDVVDDVRDDLYALRDAIKTPDAVVNEKISQVYQYTAAAFAASCATAVVAAGTGFTAVLFSSPGMALGSFLGLTAMAVVVLVATMKTAKENTPQKHLLYGLFTVCQGLVVSPLALISPVSFGAAAAITVAVTAGLGVAATRLKESFERYETILMVALGAISLCSLGALCLGGAAGAAAHQICTVGGIALFSALIVYDTHVARSEARANPAKFDAVNHSIGVYLDAMNLLVDIWKLYEQCRNK